MRTRYLTSLTDTEIEEYLKRNDITPSEGMPYLKAIARSLLRQGFRRQRGRRPTDSTGRETLAKAVRRPCQLP